MGAEEGEEEEEEEADVQEGEREQEPSRILYRALSRSLYLYPEEAEEEVRQKTMKRK